VRLEEMDTLFGDASTVFPSAQDETGSLMRAGSPVGSGHGIGAIPSFTLDDDDDNKSQIQTSGGEDRSVGGWLSRVVNRGRADSNGSGSASGSGQGRYTPLGQEDGGKGDN
jgi:hypothetical protein